MCCLLEWHPCSWLEVVRMTKWHGVHGRGGDGRLGDGLHLHCHLYVLICVLWCYEILHLILKLQWPLLEVGDLKVMIKLFVFWRSFLRVLVVSWGPCATSSQYSSSFPLRLLKVPISFCSSMWVSRISVSSISGNPFSRTLPVNPRKFVILSRY
jgi:hypothetical protein